MSKFYKVANAGINRKYCNCYLYSYNPTDEEWIWLNNMNSYWYMSKIVGIPIKTSEGGENIYPLDWIYNGRNVYYIGSGLYLWYHGANSIGYVISSHVGHGLISSMGWYQSTSFANTTYTGKGIFTGNSMTIYYGIIIGRKNNIISTYIGVYSPVSGSGLVGDKRCGWHWYFLNFGTGYTMCESNELYNDQPVHYSTHITLKRLWWDITNSLWIISSEVGVANPLIGYWSCATIVGTYTRTYTGSGIPPSPETNVISEHANPSTRYTDYFYYNGLQLSEPIFLGKIAIRAKY